MLLSMTGFGEARREADGVCVAAEVRTINNRYFKLSLRTSEDSSLLEPKVEALVRRHVRRGTVQVNLRIDRPLPADAYRINTEVLDGYRHQLESLYQLWGSSNPIHLDQLLLLPGVVDETKRVDAGEDRHWPVIEAALSEALRKLTEMRTSEGAALADDLNANCRQIAEHLDGISARLPDLASEYAARLTERVNQILDKHDVKLNPGDIVREISLFTERSDVSEEIVRLRSHLEQFQATLDLPESAGRKLDFLTQEMFREANTIGSKAGDTEIPKHVVEIKAGIERMREQVQNVE